MQEGCGAWHAGGDDNSGEIEFRIFFPTGPDPRIDAIRVTGDFQPALGGQPWDFENGLPLSKSTSDPRGTFWTARSGQAVPAGFYQYKYLVTFADGSKRKVSDPCARYGGLEHQNAAVVVGGSQPTENVVRPLPGGRMPLRDLNVYEVMIDDFTDEFRGKPARSRRGGQARLPARPRPPSTPSSSCRGRRGSTRSSTGGTSRSSTSQSRAAMPTTSTAQPRSSRG